MKIELSEDYEEKIMSGINERRKNAQNMRKKVLLKVMVTNLDIDVAMRKYSTLRMYLSHFTRTSDGGFISTAEIIKEKDALDSTTIDVRNALLDWSFNEAGQYIGDDENGDPIYKDGDANKFFKKNPKGFQFQYNKLCEL